MSHRCAKCGLFGHIAKDCKTSFEWAVNGSKRRTQQKKKDNDET